MPPLCAWIYAVIAAGVKMNHNRNKSSKLIAVCGIFSALSFVSLLFGNFIPLSTYLAPAISGIFIFPIAYEYNTKAAILIYTAVSILSVFLIPGKETVVLFIFILGWYPFAKLLLDKISNKIFQFTIKVVIFNIAVFCAYALIIFIFPITEVVSQFSNQGLLLILGFILAGNITFIIYDKALFRMYGVYIYNFRKRIFN